MKIIEWCPGNGTRYLAALHQINAEEAKQLPISEGGWIVSFPDNSFRSYCFQPHGALDEGYVASKLNIKLGGDVEAIVQLLGHVMKRPTRKKWLKCIKCGLPIHPDINKMPLCVNCQWEYPEEQREFCICGEPGWRHGTYGKCLEPSCKCEKFRHAICAFCGCKNSPHAVHNGRVLCRKCYHGEIDDPENALPRSRKVQ